MPLYEYQCDRCAHRFERIQKFSDPLVTQCPRCDGPVRKLLSSPAIQFKGTGWYVTDYARKPRPDQGADAGAPDGKRPADGKPAPAAADGKAASPGGSTGAAADAGGSAASPSSGSTAPSSPASKPSSPRGNSSSAG